ncbi:MAG: hypothetical protein WAW14_04035 [Lactococcus raffinolactis]
MYTIDDKEKATVDILQNFSDYLHLSNFFSDVIRQVIWGLIKFLNYILSNMQKSMSDVLDFLDITKNQEVMNFLNTYRPVFYAIGMIVFVVTVYFLIFKPDANFFDPIKNVLIGFGLIIALPIIFSSFSSVAKTWASVASSDTASQTVIQNNTYDVLALDQKVKWDTKNLTTPFATNYLSLPVPTYDVNGNQTNKESMKVAEKNTLNLVDTKEVVNPKDYTHYFKSDELSKEGVKVLSNALTNGVGENGSTELKLKKLQAWYKFDQYYYRFSWDTKAILFYQITAIIVTAFLIFKLIKLEYELGFIYLLFNSTAVTDSKGKRNLQLFTSMVNSFATIIMVISLSKIYDIFYSIIDTTPIFQNNFLLEVIAKIALMLAIIDGPNIFQQIFGVDAGLQSVWKSAAGLYAGGRSLGRLGKSFSNKMAGSGNGQAPGLFRKAGGVLNRAMNGAMDTAVGKDNNPIRNTGKVLKDFGNKVSNGFEDFKDNGGALGQLGFEGKYNLATESPNNVPHQSSYNEALDNLSDRNRKTQPSVSPPTPDLRRNVNMQGGRQQSPETKGTNKVAPIPSTNSHQPQRASQLLNNGLFDSGITIPKPPPRQSNSDFTSVMSTLPRIDDVPLPPPQSNSDYSSLFNSLPPIQDE